MRSFKKILALVLALMLVLCLCACNTSTEDATGDSTGSTPASSSTPLNPDDGNTEDQIPDGIQYKVKVVDEEGNPIVGVYVQLCTEETCLMPVKTDEAGVAVFTPAEEEEYHAKFTKVPEGYEADAEDFYFADGETELTIVLKAISG